ncbi:MAG: I78 family peptidase inhibitor [Pseudomonadota bacterium]
MDRSTLGRRALLQGAALVGAAGYAQAGGDDGEAGLCPELVGLTLRVVRPGDMVTMDYREDRVTVHVDENGVIERLEIG